MVTRRNFLGMLSLATCYELFPAHALARAALKKQAGGAGEEDFTRHVNLAIGTGGHGHTYPGATVPFGAVQLGPDTYDKGWDWCSGYHLSDASIMGFSHTHLSGTGCGDLLDVLLMPGTGAVKLDPGTRENPEAGYRSRFSHSDEVMEPGYYAVLLRDSNIRAELTTTERTGLHKYTFPASGDSHFMLDFKHAYSDPDNPVAAAEMTVVGADTVTGGRTVNSWAHGRQIFFAMQFSKPFAKAEIYSDGQVQADAKNAQGKALQCVLHYTMQPHEVIYVKTGISAVSAENALKNLQSEQAGWDFTATRAAAKLAWQRELRRVRIEGADPKQQAIFYTALYHMLVAPTLFDDVDGRYRGMDNQVHTLDAGQHNYSTFSLWDTYRAVHPAYTLMQPERVPQLVNCLISMAEQSPAGMPVWPLQGEETGTMTGYHSASVIAEACVKGFGGVDWQRAYKPMRKRALVDDYRGLGLDRKYGYIPADLEEESVSKTLEYGYNAWGVAQVAKVTGQQADADVLLKQSKNYQHLFDPKTQFIRAKLENGEWATPFDPKGVGHSKRWRDYTESNAWQTTFGVQHDVKGVIDAFGGREAFIQKLDALFDQSSELPPDAPPDIAGLVGQYAHGNEPSHHIAYLYVYAGAPYKTQQRVRFLLDTMYHNEPDGLAGNEDCGQMSAWYVMSAMGLYAVDPVSGSYIFGTPLFDRATVQVGAGKTLTIAAKRTSPEQKYIQSITVNGKPYDRLWIEHAVLADGAEIVFTMADQPNHELGSAQSVAPPSLTA